VASGQRAPDLAQALLHLRGVDERDPVGHAGDRGGREASRRGEWKPRRTRRRSITARCNDSKCSSRQGSRIVDGRSLPHHPTPRPGAEMPFDPVVEVSAGARPVERLVAWVGRDPARWPR